MKAETVFNVFKVLSPEEKKRFLAMCEKVEAAPKKQPLLTDEDATEYLIQKIRKK